jgi:hypothetical protein
MLLLPWKFLIQLPTYILHHLFSWTQTDDSSTFPVVTGDDTYCTYIVYNN